MAVKWIKGNILDIIQLWPYVVAAVVVILTILRQLPLYQIGLVILVAFGLAFWGINQFTVFNERRGKQFAKMSDKAVKNTIRKWLD